MKTDWKTLLLVNCIENVEVTTKILKKNFLTSGIFPVISQEAELISGYWDKSEDVFKVDRPVIIYGDHTRVVKYVNFDFVKGADGVKILKPKEILDTKYLFYYLNLYEIKSLGYARHYRLLKDLPVTYPSIEEQKRIVKILDEKFKAIEELKKVTEQQIVDAKELFKSRLNDVFENPRNSWIEVVFNDVCEITSKLIDPKDKKYQDFIHIGAGNIVAVTGELEGLKTAREEKLISGKFLFGTNMVLYSKIRPYLMKVVRPEFSGLCSADIYPLLPREDLLTRDFLFYQLLYKKFTDYAIKGSARAGMPKVNREHLFAYTFCLPSIKEQREITKELDGLSGRTKELEAIFRRKIAALEELKKSYLEQAFSGKL